MQTNQENLEESLSPGVVIHDLDRVMLSITLGDGNTLRITAKEYASMAMLVKLLGDGTLKKPIVFGRNADACRRMLALFRALVKQRLEEAREAGMDEVATRLGLINSSHVFQSVSKGGTIIEEMPMYVRGQLIGRYLTGEIEVIFNTNLFNTGIDFPACDGVMLTSPTLKIDTMTQRWGRSFRFIPQQPEKRGYLCIASTDPYEPSTAVKQRQEALGLPAGVDISDTSGDAMYRIAECITSPTDQLVSAAFSTIGGWLQNARAITTGRRRGALQPRQSLAEALVLRGSRDPQPLPLTPEHERLLFRIFKVYGRSLQPLTDVQYLDVLARWRGDAKSFDREYPAKREEYNDEVRWHIQFISSSYFI